MSTASLFDEPVDRIDPRPVFFALYPDAATIARLKELWRSLRDRFGFTSRCIMNFHVTLFLVGPQSKLTRDMIVAAKAAGDSLSAAPFDLAFDQVMTFPSHEQKQPIVMLARDGSRECLDFQRRLGLAAQKAGAIKSKVSYQPHLTLARDPRQVDPVMIETFRWTAREFSLTRSDPQHGIHEKLATWPLLAAKNEA